MYVNNINEHKDLLEQLEYEYGYFNISSIDEMIEAFGNDFEVIIDCYENDRQIITLYELKDLHFENAKLFNDIRTAFLHRDDLHELHELIEINS